jgi:hypothetical protein
VGEAPGQEISDDLARGVDAPPKGAIVSRIVEGGESAAARIVEEAVVTVLVVSDNLARIIDAVGAGGKGG